VTVQGQPTKRTWRHPAPKTPVARPSFAGALSVLRASAGWAARQMAGKRREGHDWTCPACKELVWGSKTECLRCSVPPGVCFKYWSSGECGEAVCRYRHVRKPQGPSVARAADEGDDGQLAAMTRLAARPSAARADAPFCTEVILGRLCSKPMPRAAHGGAPASCVQHDAPAVGAICSTGAAASSGDDVEQVGVAYLSDATASVAVLMGQALEPLCLAQGLLLVAGFNLVHLPPRAHEASASAASPRAPSAGLCHLEMWDAEVIASCSHGCFQAPVHTSQDELEEAALDAADDAAAAPAPRRRLFNVKGIVLSISHLICKKSDKGRVYYFILQLGHLPDLGQRGQEHQDLAGTNTLQRKPSPLPPSPDAQGDSASLAALAGQCKVRSKLVVFQGRGLMKWFALLRPGARVVLTALTRAQLDGTIPVWRATAAQERSAPPVAEAPQPPPQHPAPFTVVFALTQPAEFSRSSSRSGGSSSEAGNGGSDTVLTRCGDQGALAHVAPRRGDDMRAWADSGGAGTAPQQPPLGPPPSACSIAPTSWYQDVRLAGGDSAWARGLDQQGVIDYEGLVTAVVPGLCGLVALLLGAPPVASPHARVVVLFLIVCA